MWTLLAILLAIFTTANTNVADESEDPVLYYYGLEESERSLPRCTWRQACSALVERYWRAPALLRLCRCARRTRCDALTAHSFTIPINSRAYFQFCQPVSGWPECGIGDTPLTVDSAHERMNPDELEQMHHTNRHLPPPKIVFHCQCPQPNYWKLNITSSIDSDSTQYYRCGSLPPCKTDDYCGNVSYDLNALYQSCLCPKHHICVHDGGVTHLYITELLYRGKGWRAHCRRTADFSYEDYYS